MVAESALTPQPRQGSASRARAAPKSVPEPKGEPRGRSPVPPPSEMSQRGTAITGRATEALLSPREPHAEPDNHSKYHLRQFRKSQRSGRGTGALRCHTHASAQTSSLNISLATPHPLQLLLSLLLPTRRATLDTLPSVIVSPRTATPRSLPRHFQVIDQLRFYQ